MQIRISDQLCKSHNLEAKNDSFRTFLVRGAERYPIWANKSLQIPWFSTENNLQQKLKPKICGILEEKYCYLDEMLINFWGWSTDKKYQTDLGLFV